MSLFVCFYLAPPKRLPKNRTWPSVKPDLDKLVRGVCDALTNVLWQDDSQVVQIVASKRYADPSVAGAHVSVEKFA